MRVSEVCAGFASVESYSTITRAEKNEEGIFYIAFTSGSTGTPKGVQIGYDNFFSFYAWYGALLQSCRGTGAHVNHASLSFDMGMLDLWPPLALGRPVILLNHRHNALPVLLKGWRNQRIWRRTRLRAASDFAGRLNWFG